MPGAAANESCCPAAHRCPAVQDTHNRRSMSLEAVIEMSGDTAYQQAGRLVDGAPRVLPPAADELELGLLLLMEGRQVYTH